MSVLILQDMALVLVLIQKFQLRQDLRSALGLAIVGNRPVKTCPLLKLRIPAVLLSQASAPRAELGVYLWVPAANIRLTSSAQSQELQTTATIAFGREMFAAPGDAPTLLVKSVPRNLATDF